MDLPEALNPLAGQEQVGEGGPCVFSHERLSVTDCKMNDYIDSTAGETPHSYKYEESNTMAWSDGLFVLVSSVDSKTGQHPRHIELTGCRVTVTALAVTSADAPKSSER